MLGVAGDVMTIVNPGLENKTEGNVMRGAAAANIVGTGMAFSGTLAAAVLAILADRGDAQLPALTREGAARAG